MIRVRRVHPVLGAARLDGKRFLNKKQARVREVPQEIAASLYVCEGQSIYKLKAEIKAYSSFHVARPNAALFRLRSM